MADKKIKVKVDVETNAAGSIAELKALKRELKNTAAGTEEFKKLYNQIDDLEDKIKSAKNQSADWIDSLEAAGGPLGALGGALNKAKVATQSWGAALKATGIGLIVAALGGLVAALSKSDETMKKFEPVLIAFEQILNGVLGALQPIIDGMLDLAMKAMPYVSKAFKVAYSAISSFVQGVGLLGKAIGQVFRGEFSAAWDTAKSAVTGFTTRYEEAAVRFEAGTKKMTKTQKENLKEQKKDLKEHVDDAKRIREEELKELLQGQKDAFLELLSEREAEEYKVREHYANLLYLATKYGDDRSQLLLAQQNALDEIDKKYKDKEAEKLAKEAEEKKKNAEEFAKYMNDQYTKIKELEAQREEVTFKTNQAVSQSWVDLGSNIAGIFGSLVNVFEQGSDMAKAFGIAQVAINAAASIGQILVNARAAQFEYDKAIATGNASILAGIPKLVNPVTAALGAAEIAAGKAAVAGGIAGKAATKVNTGLQVAAVGVASAAQIAAILSAGQGGKGASSGGSSASASSGGGGAAPVAPQVASVSAPQVQTTGGQNPNAQLAETLVGATKPVRAYVVSQDISSQQALDRRTNRAATFSGG